MDKKGFAAMTPERRAEISAMGGRAVHAAGKARRFSPEEARKFGRLGGLTVSADREHMAAVGRLGGLKVSADREHMVKIARMRRPAPPAGPAADPAVDSAADPAEVPSNAVPNETTS